MVASWLVNVLITMGYILHIGAVITLVKVG
jgi:hypothetical protein